MPPPAPARASGAVPLAAVAFALLACDGEDGRPGRRPSDGSSLEGPRVWQAGAAEEWLGMTELPPDTLSVTLMVTGAPTDQLSLEVRDRQGRQLSHPLDFARSINRLLPGQGLMVGTIPSASAALPLSSNYAVKAHRSGPASPQALSISAWIKRSRGAPPAVQELPLSVLLVGRAGALPAAALAATLARVGEIWRGAGIELLEAPAVRVEGPDRVMVDPALAQETPAVGEVLALSARAPGTLAVVVVDQLMLGGQTDFELWAMSGSIPVPPVAGTPRSGVLTSAAIIARDPALAGQTLAHELGHALGLYHTTERALEAGAAIHDQLDDTPACPTEADVNHDRELSVAECAGRDAGNLMFPLVERGTVQLTPGQAALARRSPLVR